MTVGLWDILGSSAGNKLKNALGVNYQNGITVQSNLWKLGRKYLDRVGLEPELQRNVTTVKRKGM